ncbi:hypothetical protein HPB52_007713 [Rhipicephalus sanguineus]|uniref:Regulatory protein zeste n=1 Tax=Rhipicephalus sanguineus TaxID=34632 RepID=A0A9D4PT90_RHISA|nr:hypothetical protein HPB52_007713 [Rhipicephalus sanguineus]
MAQHAKKGQRVPDNQRELLLVFMEQHPQLTTRASEFTPDFTAAERHRLWLELADVLNREGPVTKSLEQWQDWWRKQVYDARQDAAAVAEVQRTGGGRASGFRGRVLQLTGTLRLTGARRLDYQADTAPPAPMEVTTEVAGTSATSTGPQTPAAAQPAATPAGAPTAPPRQRRPVRPPRQRRPLRVDVLTDIQAQCAESLLQGTDLLRVAEAMRSSMERTRHSRGTEHGPAAANGGGCGKGG